MTFEELARRRYSVRKFEERPVEAEKLDALLRVASLAPTGCNNQPQRIFALQSEEARAKAALCTRCTFGAPLIFLVCYDQTASWHRKYDGYQCGETDAAIVTAHLALEAVELGLGTCWVAAFDPAETRRQFELPDNLVPAAFLPTGYPLAEPSPMHGDRAPYAEYTKIL